MQATVFQPQISTEVLRFVLSCALTLTIPMFSLDLLEYVNIDDCWQVMRSPNGSINADPERFPGGMKALADYVHSKNLKFGVCECCRLCCATAYVSSSLHQAVKFLSFCTTFPPPTKYL